MKLVEIKELFDLVKENKLTQEEVTIEGWVRTNRDNGSFGFIELNDGTFFKNVQVVYSNKLNNYQDVSKMLTGCCVSVTGNLVLTPENKQPFELQATSITLLGNVDEDYPLQKKRHTFEFLREIPHLRPRTNTFSAVFRIRSVLSMAIHEYFQSNGFVYVQTPIITSNDAEGAGEAFTVTTRSDGNYEKDFFAKKASLTVSGQLNVEAFALAFGKVYTFGPTFRAENSNTARHAAEFWQIEPEIAFADLSKNMEIIEGAVKYCIKYVLEKAPEEMKFFDSIIEPGLINRLTSLINKPFKRMSYTEGIKLLEEAVKEGHKFEVNDIKWGMDLQSEHERYLCEHVVNGPVFLTDYPKDIKSFYMRLNDDGKTVAACDLLVPGVGELVGGSQREERIDYLLKRMDELKMDKSILTWYIDLRRFGGCVHSGFGIGFERLIMYITGMSNIRDVLPYPRTPRNLEC